MDYARLRAQALTNGDDEEAVTVDTRALIDKVLARYSGEWTTLRELIQNAADAQATTVKVKFETLPSTSVPLPQTTNQSELLRHAVQNHTLRRLVVQNDGQPFTKTDWARLKRIAEGNPDETKIGAFGVGFYSVFADCEEPFVSSGSEAMAFYWKGNALFTKKYSLPQEQVTKDTAFVLDYRNTTTPLPNLLSVSQFLATSLTFVALQNVEFWIDDWRILSLQKKSSPSLGIAIPRDLETRAQGGLMKLKAAGRTSTQIDGTFMSVIGWKPQAVASNRNNEQHTSELPSLRSFFSRLTSATSQAGLRGKAAREEQVVQDTIAEDLTALSTSTIFLRVTAATIETNVSASFSAELERATKKPPPRETKLSILTSSYDETVASEMSASSQAAKVADIFASVLPSKKPGGRIFIGFPTAQTTGAGMHIFAPSVIPTVEREAIDLNARWVRTWNQDMLRVAGIISRLAFINEMADLNQKLNDLSTDNKKGPSSADVDKFVPEALHILKTYTFLDSTPSSMVGQLIEEAFWTAWKRPSIEVFSSRGVLSTSKVRNSSEEVSKFVGGIPVILNSMKDDPFIRKLIDFELIKDVTVDDICQELSAKAMDKDQLRHFIQWIANSAAAADYAHADLKRLLDIAVATVSEGGDSGEIITLGTILFYHNKNIPATLPVPPTCLPHAFTANIPEVKLRALGWEPLGIVPWVRFLIGFAGQKEEQNLMRNAAFAVQVLTVLSKNWDNLSPSSKSSVESALRNITVMPTKMGMKKPSESFFPSVKLFDDLPTLEGCANVKEKFLTTLGVRKTVDLDTIFTRLLSPSPSAGGDATPRWSHMELIRYLASVEADIPAADMRKLRESPLCPAEDGPRGMEPTKGTSRLYKVSELFEPKDTLRALRLPVLQWPGPPGSFRPSGKEGRFLATLGLRPYPSVPELVEMMASPDEELRRNAMTYFIQNHSVHGYASFDVSKTPKAILPIEGDEKALVAPSQCFVNERAAVLGYKILRKQLHDHAPKFGVQRDPHIMLCVEQLLANPPKDRSNAITLFEYFSSRLADLNLTALAQLKSAAIVPVVRKKNASFGFGAKAEESIVYVKPQNCYLGNSTTYGDIFDFVDFGPNANTFLFKCGARTEPTKHEIATLACSEPARLLSVMQSPDKYLSLLRSLADDWGTLKKDRELVKKMKSAAWLLGSKELVTSKQKESEDLSYEEEEAPVKHYILAAPKDIVILDDYICYRLFKESLLCAPEDETLEAFYQALGSENLGSRVKEEILVGAHRSRQDGAEWLRKHVVERSKIFLHEYAKDKRDLVRRDAKWLESNLKVISVSSVGLRRSLQGHNKYHQEKRSAASTHGHNGWVLYVAAEHKDDKPDMYQVGQAICQLLLNRPNQSSYFFFEPFLKLGLLQLRDRGYNVDRILRAKAAEARIAEEERRKALEAEQSKIREREQEWEHSRAAEVKTPTRDRMPGAFHDSPEDDHALPPTPQQQRPKQRGFFSDLTRRLGLDTGDDDEQQNQLNNFIPTQTEQDTKGPGSSGENRGRQPDDGRVTSPAVVHQNLLNAINSTRAHDSTNLFSPPSEREVKEKATYCDATPAQNIVFAADAPRGMRVFVARDLSVDASTFLANNIDAIKQFEILLRDCGEIYRLPAKALHIFYDETGGTIAFNANGSIFCNLRFFNQLHRVQQGGRLEGQKKVEATTWWWVVLAHELAHNLVTTHDSQHSYYTESFIQQYFPAMMAKAVSWGGNAGAPSALPSTAATTGIPSGRQQSVSRAEAQQVAPPPYSEGRFGPNNGASYW
ncbi:hypothetical protein QBC40DRAFT_273020 [Triangularia verruculosa]|uniref:Sacsin/Nov domain-containing protein n=1 Tax=Triangularia verruculosa TaxID=2587418 RepID=A0AAN6XR81_9PEZI|nr:hypothetical protein QBC40DRAFT_273020 [Triangularia verruculosa]